MKRIGGTLLVLMMAAMLVMAPAGVAETPGDKGSAAKVKQEAQELMRALKAYGADQRDEAVHKTEEAMERLDRRIETLQKRIDEEWHTMDKAAREKAQKTRETLRRHRAELGEWYDKMKEGSTDAWEQVKQGFADAYRAFYSAWDSAEKDMDAKK